MAHLAAVLDLVMMMYVGGALASTQLKYPVWWHAPFEAGTGYASEVRGALVL